MIPVTVKNISISNMGFVVFLGNDEDPRVLPIVIGAAEAQAIIIKLNKIPIPRPLTHDLLKNILDLIEGRLQKIIINDLRDGTFFAKLMLHYGDRVEEVDSRPSDAIALSLRCHTPIFVEEHVMDEAGVVISEDDLKDKEETDQINIDSDEILDPVEKLKRQLEKAISEERYEDAANLRDEIKKASTSN